MVQTTSDWRRHFDPATLERLQGLSLPSPRRSAGLLAGHRRNPRLGGSADFSQHRQYVPGDDLRWVDWKVFGRTDRYFLKQREDESNLICHLVIDASASMKYQGASAAFDKLEFTRRFAAAVAYVAMTNRDGVSLTTFNSQPQSMLRSMAGGPGSVRLVAEALDRIIAGGETDLARVLSIVAQRLPRRGMLMLISDMMDDPETVAAGIRGLASRGHRLVVVQVVDRDEEELPWYGPVRLIGLESEPAIAMEAAEMRRSYRDEHARLRTTIAAACRDVAADWLTVCTDQSIPTVLQQWIAGSSSRT